MLSKALTSVLATFAAANINEDRQNLLNGGEQLHATDMEPLWNQFKTEFEHISPVELDQNAMFTFFQNVDKVIEHNSKDTKTYTKVINKFSAMTFEQFSDYFNLEDN